MCSHFDLQHVCSARVWKLVKVMSQSSQLFCSGRSLRSIPASNAVRVELVHCPSDQPMPLRSKNVLGNSNKIPLTTVSGK